MGILPMWGFHLVGKVVWGKLCGDFTLWGSYLWGSCLWGNPLWGNRREPYDKYTLHISKIEGM